MAASKRPRWRFQPIKSGPYTATAARKPKADDPSRPYVRLTYRPCGEEKKAARFADGSPAAGYYTRSEAQQVLARLNREVPNPVAEAEREALVVVRHIRDLVPAFLGSLRDVGKSTKQVKTYERALQRLLDRGWGDRRVSEVGSKHRMRVLFSELQKPWDQDRYARVREHGLSPSTSWNTINALFIAARHGMREGWFSEFPLPQRKDFEIPSREEAGRYNRRTPTPDEIRRVRAHIGEDSEVGQVIAIQAELGCRVGALTQLRSDHIDLDQRTLTLKAKGGWRTVTFPRALDALLRRLREGEGDGTGRVFRTPWQSLRTQVNREIGKACAGLGIERFTSHGLRRRKSTDLIADRRVGPKDYEAIMGHRHRMGLDLYAEENRDAQRAALEAVSIGVATPALDPDEAPEPGRAAGRRSRKAARRSGHRTRTQRVATPPRHPIPILVPVVIPTNAEALKMLKTGSR